MIEAACPDCGSTDLFLHRARGEVICKKCAFVLEDAPVDFGPDWRDFDNEDGGADHRHSGAPFDPRISNNLATTVGNLSDLSSFSGKHKTRIKRLRAKQGWAATGFEHRLDQALSHLKMLTARMDIPSYIEKDAAELYREAVARNLARCRPTEHLIAASVWIACKRNQAPIAWKEFANKADIDLRTLHRTTKLLIRTLNLKLTPASPIDFIAKFSTKLQLTHAVEAKAVKLLQDFMKKKSGMNPLSLAATAIYVACNHAKVQRTQKSIAQTAGITETTLRNTLQMLFPPKKAVKQSKRKTVKSKRRKFK